MSQQINLFNPIFLQQKKIFSSRTMAQALAVLVLGVTAMAAYGDMRVKSLQRQADAGAAQLQQRQARETGICPVREELYAQAFDEVIRQTTLGCVERGRLLLRVRDEVRMTTAAYQALYESSVAFGMRKALMAEWGQFCTAKS